MKCIVKNRISIANEKVFEDVEKKYSIQIRKEIKEFLKVNGGGYPEKDVIIADEEEYEVRVFLSLDEKDNNYYVRKPMQYFLEKTKGKIVPIGIDSGDNYYCINNDTGKVYYWSSGENQYYCISQSLEEFVLLFQ